MNPRNRRPHLLLAAATSAIALLTGCTGDRPADRQAEIAARGSSVMPFDLERTTHRFAKADTGGTQTVVADDPRSTDQIALIRQHLTAEVERFRAGDFADPARIHGTEMPGLAELRAHGGRIAITYENTPDGARVTYTTDDDKLRDALHHWFDAQVSDHGEHATG
ncbi:hypothetical protein AB0G04_11865 [Actinoplanes sp. NPDC023801]|uniref:hypothetical protein n=1 Tax=Actinoplanes sp. NPDC023801 TaxID=3154595 RepID=UPI00340F6084